MSTKNAVELLLGAAAALSRTPAGQRLKQQAAEKVMHLLETGERSLQAWRSRTQSAIGDRTGGARSGSSGRATRSAGSEGRRGSRAGQATERGASRAHTAESDETDAIPPRFNMSERTGRSFNPDLTPRESVSSIPAWQDKLRMKNVRGSRPVMNTGVGLGRSGPR